MYTLKVLLPQRSVDEFLCRGYVSREGTLITVFFKNNKDVIETGTDIVYGVLTKETDCKSDIDIPNFIKFVSKGNGYLEILDFRLNHKVVPTERVIIMFYDQLSFNKSEALDEELWVNISIPKVRTMQNKIPDKNDIENPKNKWLALSMFIQHLISYYYLIKWIFTSSRKGKWVSVQHGNLLVAIFVDILIGYLLLEYLTPDKDTIRDILMGTLEVLLDSMYSLLKWLMGAPAGLKLNNAFNKMLGRYFSYHVHLWWLFIDISGDKLDLILSAYHYISYFGVTFQAALISDMICIVTFHSYCIYVYAARLFNMQISGLTALLRLFVGRKYNPLRKAVDSCEYTNQELFVGTVAFAVLLLLLPTTTMYYIVFTVFRLLSLIVQYALAKVIYWLQSMPLYVMILKAINSPKVAGNIHIEVLNCEDYKPLVLEVRLLSKSLEDLIPRFKPPIKMINRIEWTGVLKRVLTGKPLTC